MSSWAPDYNSMHNNIIVPTTKQERYGKSTLSQLAMINNLSPLVAIIILFSLLSVLLFNLSNSARACTWMNR